MDPVGAKHKPSVQPPAKRIAGVAIGDWLAIGKLSCLCGQGSECGASFVPTASDVPRRSLGGNPEIVAPCFGDADIDRNAKGLADVVAMVSEAVATRKRSVTFSWTRIGNHNELLAAKPAGKILRPLSYLDELAEHFQRGVCHRMPVGIVGCLESIDVQHEYGERRLAVGKPSEFPIRKCRLGVLGFTRLDSATTRRQSRRKARAILMKRRIWVTRRGR